MKDDKLNNIIKIVKDAYPLDVIDDIWDWENSKLCDDADRAGDSFAVGVIREICDCYDDSRDYVINLLEIHKALVIAGIDLQAVEKELNIHIEKEISK